MQRAGVQIRDTVQLTDRRLTDEGFLVVDALIARAGVQAYHARELGLKDRDPNEVVRLYRPEAEVFDEKSLASYCGKPVTDNHPSEFVNSRNARRFTVGHVSDAVSRQGEHVAGRLTVITAEAVDAVQSGKVEVSAGYELDIETTAGKTDAGEAYDAIAKNIRVNHVALVDRGRCGGSCRITDCESCSTREGNHVKTITIDGITVEGVPEQAAQLFDREIEKLKGSNSALETRVADAEKAKETAEGALAAEKKRAEDAEKALKDATSAEALDAAVAERASVIEIAKVHVKDFDPKGKTSDAIRREVLVASGVMTADAEKSDEYVAAAFDGLAKTKSGGEAAKLATSLRDTAAKDAKPSGGRAAYMTRVSGAYDSAAGGAN